MKIGLRKPSLKKSLKARTVGKWKRKAKSAFNPFYGKKGVGLLKNPSKSIKSRVYKRTTVGVNPLSGLDGSKGKRKPQGAKAQGKETNHKEKPPLKWGKVDAWGIGIFSVGFFLYYLSNDTGFLLSLGSGPLAGFLVWLLFKSLAR